MSEATPRLLLLEDSNLDAELLREQLSTMQPVPLTRVVQNREAFVQALEGKDFDLILSDFSLPDFDGMTALELANAAVPDIPFIFVSGVLGEEAAIESFRRGATDYVLKQRLIRLPAAVDRALAEAREKAEHRRVQQQKELLVRELSHRVKNTMAMVMSLVRRTAKNSRTVEDYSANLTGRLRAMADAHSLLFESNWSRARLVDVVQRTLDPHIQGRGERFRITPGPAVTLDPRAALAFSMIVNELATNAVKYGALKSDGGHIAISWSPEGDSIVFDWHEQGGPPVSQPDRSGFGTTLVQRSVEYELQGDVAFDYAATGLQCTICFPDQQVT